ncbi:hypothetical protein XACG102_10510004 [Xanthomonas citri pv. citri]|nr:hypothetical protein XACG102_10510004 [Xanthomonas citri pv. citri]
MGPAVFASLGDFRQHRLITDSSDSCANLNEDRSELFGPYAAALGEQVFLQPAEAAQFVDDVRLNLAACASAEAARAQVLRHGDT